MVTRKPVPPPTGNSLPYPLSPSSPRSQQPFDRDAETENNVWSSEERPTARPAAPYPRDSTADIPGINDGWTDLGDNSEGNIDRSSLPAPLRINKQKSTESIGPQQDVPPSSRSGQQVITPKSSWETDRSIDDVFDTQNSSDPHPPAHAPPEVPKISTNPFHRAASAERAPQVPWEPPTDNGSNIWAELAENPTPSTQRAPLHQQFGELKVDGKQSEFLPPVPEHQPPPPPHTGGDEALISFDPAHDYQQVLPQDPFGSSQEQDPWKTEQSVAPSSPKGKGKEIDLPAEATENPFELPKLETDLGNNLSAQPPQRPQPSSPALERKIVVSEEVANRQRSETYQIKHIRWLDASSHEAKTTPILIQNKNGPCPLLALVNALTLSTPSNFHTGLIETLRVREQISLGLLLDAVFDELMSGRRGDAAQELPDVGELYAFLITLHTGMNVNPRFVPMRRKEQSLVDGLETDVSLTLQDYRRPGTFEHTKEMLLYSTFSVPLLHGWIPAKAHQAFQALERSAQSYEDAQNLLFREEELEDKLQTSGLSHDEQQMLEDIASIKYFLNSSATQLTGYGLDIIHDTLRPGEIVILFRNDHFSTLYKHPRSGQLLQLITDAGYSSHDEVVWESLVDVHGEGTEFFSGDFRTVSHDTNHASSQQQAFELAGDDSSSWKTVSRNGRKAGMAPTSPSSENNRPLPGLPPRPAESTSIGGGGSTEQEDADLALAMQLQEEEEDRSRRSNAARQRENELSKAYLTSQNLPVQHLDSNANSNSQSSLSSPNNTAAGRRSTTQTVRPLLPPRRDPASTSRNQAVHREPTADTAADDDAPPSYEQAAKSEPYNPPPGEPGAIGGSGSGVGAGVGQAGSRPPQSQNQNSSSTSNLPMGGRPRGQSAYSANSVNMAAPSGQRRRSGMPGSYGGSSGSYQDLGAASGSNRRRSAGVPAAGLGGPGAEERREKDCVVM